jgi:EmrB/QacA subfamily drug resistance transporter
MGLWGSNVGVALGVGPIIGGLLVNDLGWRWVFWACALLGIASVVLSAYLLPPAHDFGHRPSLDVPGIVLIGGLVFALSYALVEGHTRGWTSALIIGCFVASAVLAVLFAIRELTTAEPMLDLALFREPAFSAGTVVTMIISFGLLGIFVFMPLYFQGAHHETALQSGLDLLPMAVAMAVVGPIGGYLAHRFPPHWPVVAAMSLFAIGMFWLAHLTTITPWLWLAGPFLVIGTGLGISSANINTAVMHAVPRHSAGAAAGVIATVRQLGSVLGVAVLGAVLQNRESIHLANILQAQPHASHTVRSAASLTAFTDGLNDAFTVAAIVLAFGAVAALFVRHRET